VVGALTLRAGDVDPSRLSGLDANCLICGSRGAADAVLNLALFIPLGVALGGRPAARAVPGAFLVGAVLSFGIELLQTALPGRHGGIADVVWNSAGAATGALLIHLAARRLVAPSRFHGAGAVALVGAGLLLAGLLAKPAPTDGDYWVLFTPRLGGDPPYGGSVLRAGFAGVPLEPGPLPDTSVRHGVRSRSWRVDARVTVGPPPRPLLPIILFGDPMHPPGEILLVGAQRTDLVVRERTRSSHLRFDTPDLRLEHAFRGLREGDTVSIAIERRDERLCMEAGDRRSCPIGISPGRTWGFLVYLEGPSEWQRRVVDFAWLLLLFFPAGYFAATRRDALLSTGVSAAALAGAALLTPLIFPPPLEFLATAAGIAAGYGARAALARLDRSGKTRAHGRTGHERQAGDGVGVDGTLE
jgi:hypothetical protein